MSKIENTIPAAFTAQQITAGFSKPGEQFECAAGSDVIDCLNLAVKALPEAFEMVEQPEPDRDCPPFNVKGDLTKDRYGNLFTYMWRRFGPPPFGSDDYKEIANWFITTPMPHVYLGVNPNPSGLLYAFRYAVSSEIIQQLREPKREWRKAMQRWEQDGKVGPEPESPRFYEDWDEESSDSMLYRVNNALVAAIQDLRRPTYVRDVYINCFGRVADSELTFSSDDEDSGPDCVEYFKHAGYGIDHCIFENFDQWCEFKKLAIRQGRGSFTNGLKHLLAPTSTPPG